MKLIDGQRQKSLFFALGEEMATDASGQLVFSLGYICMAWDGVGLASEATRAKSWHFKAQFNEIVLFSIVVQLAVSNGIWTACVEF